jgi:DNA repair photolyase
MLQDVDLLKAFGKKLNVGVSFTTDDEGIRREFEPDAPSLKRRLELIRKLREKNIFVYASIAPLLRCDREGANF